VSASYRCDTQGTMNRRVIFARILGSTVTLVVALFLGSALPLAGRNQQKAANSCSLSLSLDAAHTDQQLLGYRTLHLLNSNQDPTFLRSVLFLDVARDYMPALKANFARVVINRESWGVYTNQESFSKDFVQEAFKTTGGTRWKSPNNSVGGGLSYLGDDPALYRRWYEMKGKDDPAAWAALVHVCKVLNETPPEQLEKALAPYMDVDGVLRFLALDIALVNNDGYWNDGSDFNLYWDPTGRFHPTFHDINEGFRTGGRAGGAAQPDPLSVLDDPNKALRQKLLAVPALRTRYLTYVGDISETWLDWNRLGPIVERYQKLIADDVAQDTRKRTSAGRRCPVIPRSSRHGDGSDERGCATCVHPDPPVSSS
jgi:CotH kinase protein